MSTSSLAVIGAQVKLWNTFLRLILLSLCCCYTQQSVVSCSKTGSMRLRPKRTSSGFECFGSFPIRSLYNYQSF